MHEPPIVELRSLAQAIDRLADESEGREIKLIEERDELGEGLRDAAGAVDPNVFLPIAVAGLTASIDAHAAAAAAGDGRGDTVDASVTSVEGWTFVHS